MIPAEHRMVIINSRMYAYDKIKDKVIKNQADFFKLTNTNAVSHFKNKIVCYNKLLGGVDNKFKEVI